jgi:hypothetical protein
VRLQAYRLHVRTFQHSKQPQANAELAALLAERFPQSPLAVHHRVWAAIGYR